MLELCLRQAFYWGTSEWTAQQITEAWEVAKRLDLIGPTMVRRKHPHLLSATAWAADSRCRRRQPALCVASRRSSTPRVDTSDTLLSMGCDAVQCCSWCCRSSLSTTCSSAAKWRASICPWCAVAAAGVTACTASMYSEEYCPSVTGTPLSAMAHCTLLCNATTLTLRMFCLYD